MVSLLAIVRVSILPSSLPNTRAQAMVRFNTCFTVLGVVQCARVKTSVPEDLGSFVMLEPIAAANGMMDVNFGGELSPKCESESYDPELSPGRLWVS